MQRYSLRLQHCLYPGGHAARVNEQMRPLRLHQGIPGGYAYIYSPLIFPATLLRAALHRLPRFAAYMPQIRCGKGGGMYKSGSRISQIWSISYSACAKAPIVSEVSPGPVIAKTYCAAAISTSIL